jgi:NADH-quinone oxidoreductase subunit M
MIATLASVGLPGTNGFVGEFLVLLGTFRSEALGAIFGQEWAGQLLAALAALGVILGAVYMLWLVQRVFFGPLDRPANQKLKDLSLREAWVLVPMILAIFLIGLFPNIFLGRAEHSIRSFVSDIHQRAGLSAPSLGEGGTTGDTSGAALLNGSLPSAARPKRASCSGQLRLRAPRNRLNEARSAQPTGGPPPARSDSEHRRGMSALSRTAPGVVAGGGAW